MSINKPSRNAIVHLTSSRNVNLSLFASIVLVLTTSFTILLVAAEENTSTTGATTPTKKTSLTSIERLPLEQTPVVLDKDEEDEPAIRNSILQSEKPQLGQTHFLRRKLKEEEEEEVSTMIEPLKYTQEYILEKEKHGSCLYPNLDETHKLASMYIQNPELESLPKPIINLGMPRCGSTSLYTFFECSGMYKTSHYFCDNNDDNDIELENHNTQNRQRCGTCMKDSAEQGLPIIDNCGMYDVYTQIDTEGLDECIFPQITYLKEIHDNYPNATFLLPFRDIDHWIKSIQNFQLKKSKLYWNTKQLYHPTLKDILSNCHIEPLLPKGYGTRNDELIQFICQHVTNVRNFVTKYPTHTLIEINIEGNHTGNILSKIFNIDPKCWHHVNHNTEVAEDKSLTRDIILKEGEIICT